MQIKQKTTYGEGRVTNYILEVEDAPPIIHDVVDHHLLAVNTLVTALCGLYEMAHNVESRVASLERAESVNATIEERLDSLETKHANDRDTLHHVVSDVMDLKAQTAGTGKSVGEIADDVIAKREREVDKLAVMGAMNLDFTDVIKTGRQLFSEEELDAALKAFWRALDENLFQ